MNSVIIGQRIKDARKSMNLTQKELGYLIYADGKYISRLENGGSLPSLKRLVLLSRVLNRTCDYFIWDIDVMEEDVTPRRKSLSGMNRSGSFCSFGGRYAEDCCVQ